jgi:hypothetical protein
MAAPPSTHPIEIRRRLWEASWQRLLRPLPDETADPEPATQPTADERAERDEDRDAAA